VGTGLEEDIILEEECSLEAFNTLEDIAEEEHSLVASDIQEDTAPIAREDITIPILGPTRILAWVVDIRAWEV
jgi:hypothetical protein